MRRLLLQAVAMTLAIARCVNACWEPQLGGPINVMAVLTRGRRGLSGAAVVTRVLVVITAVSSAVSAVAGVAVGGAGWGRGRGG